MNLLSLLEKCEDRFGKALSEDLDKKEAFGEICALMDHIREETKEKNGVANIIENIRKFETHVGIALGQRENFNGQDLNQHERWALGALRVLEDILR